MGTALAQYFGLLNCLDCNDDIIYAGVVGFMFGVGLALLSAWLLRNKL